MSTRCAEDGANVVVAAHVRRIKVALADRGEGRRIEQAPRELEASDHVLDVAIVAKKIGVDQGRGSRVGIAQAKRAAAVRPQQAEMAGIAMREPQLARVIFDQRDHEMQLDVRLGKVRPGFQESAGFGEIAGRSCRAARGDSARFRAAGAPRRAA